MTVALQIAATLLLEMGLHQSGHLVVRQTLDLAEQAGSQQDLGIVLDQFLSCRLIFSDLETFPEADVSDGIGL